MEVGHLRPTHIWLTCRQFDKALRIIRLATKVHSVELINCSFLEHSDFWTIGLELMHSNCVPELGSGRHWEKLPNHQDSFAASQLPDPLPKVDPSPIMARSAMPGDDILVANTALHIRPRQR